MDHRTGRLPFLTHALELRKKLFGEKHPAVALSYNNVGGTWGALGNHQKALEMQSHALELQKQLFGEKHPDVANSYCKIGCVYLNLKDNFSAIKSLQTALRIYQTFPSYRVHPDVANVYRWLARAYFNFGNRQKSIEHQQEATKIEQMLDNQALWKKMSSQLHALILNKQYKKAFDLIAHGPKELKNMPEVLCSHMQLSFLCSNQRVVKMRGTFIEQAEQMVENPQILPENRIKLQLNLAVYWIQQKQWDKVLQNAHQLSQLSTDINITYELLDILFMQENEQVLGEMISAHLMGSYLALIAYQGKGSLAIVKIGAQQLLEKITKLSDIGVKLKEMKSFCSNCISGL